MSPLEYIAGSLPWWHQYVLLVALFLTLHLPLIRRWAVGIYDPLFLLLLANVFGWAIVWFMYLRDDIAPAYVASFTVSQLAFYLGIGMGRRRRRKVASSPISYSDVTTPKLTLAIAAAVHIASTLSIWSIAGIPLFRASRLGAFEGSGGYGILERLAESSALIAIFAVVYLLIQHRRLRRSPLVLGFMLWYLISIGLSGSKGALLSVGQYVLSIVFVYTNLRDQQHRFWGGRAGKSLLIGAPLFALGILATQQESDFFTALLGFVYRIVSYGDVYIFAYPDAAIESVRGDNPLIGMFGGILSTFRLFPQELVYPNIGIQFTGIVFPDLDLAVGPNPQHPVFGYHYFGWFAFAFSFVLGVLTSRVQANFFFCSRRNFFGGLIAFMLYFGLVSISVDFEYTLSKVASAIIGMVLIVGPVLLLRPGAARPRSRRRGRTQVALEPARNG